MNEKSITLDTILHSAYVLVKDPATGQLIKVQNVAPHDPDTDTRPKPFADSGTYYMRIAEYEYGENGLYRKLGKTGPLEELAAFIAALGPEPFTNTENNPSYNIKAQETVRKLIENSVIKNRKYSLLESRSLGTNYGYKKFKSMVEREVKFSDKDILDRVIERSIPGAENEQKRSFTKLWLQKYYIFSIYEKMLWSGTERHKKYRVDADWHKMLEIVFASHYLNKDLDVPNGLYKPFTKKIGDYYYFILNHTNLGGYCYLIQQICTDSSFFDFVKSYEYGTLFSRDRFFDEKTSKLLYQLLADENNRIYPFTYRKAGYKAILNGWIGEDNWKKTVYPSDSDALSVKLAWAAKIIHTHTGTKYIKCYAQEENSKKQQLIIKKIDKVSASDSSTSGYYTLKPLDDADIALLRDGRLAAAKMRYLQNKVRLINLLAYDKLGEDYNRPVEERIQICLDLINNDPQVKSLESWEQFYDDWRAKFKEQLKRLSDLIAIHLDPEYRDYGPCVLDERLEKAYAQLTDMESSLIDKKEKSIPKNS